MGQGQHVPRVLWVLEPRPSQAWVSILFPPEGSRDVKASPRGLAMSV